MSPLHTCPNGHRFNKTSACPVCPTCEAQRPARSNWQAAFSAPAQRALGTAGIRTVKQLARLTQQEVLALHGIGPASLPGLQRALDQAGLAFKAPAKAAKPVVAPGTDPIKAYYQALAKPQRTALQHLHKLILRTVPGIEEHFGYGMPAFKYNGHPMLYLGVGKAHCALYGEVPPGLKAQLAGFKSSKGAVQFTPEKPLPDAVVRAIVYAKVAQIEERWGSPGSKAKKK